MHYYKTIIRYEGSSYIGFQWQRENKTVQGQLNEALLKMSDAKITTRGASRTDTGVHAMEQVVKISSEIELNTLSFVQEINTHLPGNIKCLEIKNCSGSFNPGLDALSKEYRYFFTNKTRPSQEDCPFFANISNKLDLNLMSECAQLLNGCHDFKNFYSSGSNVKSTVRNIFFCELKLINPRDIFLDQDLFNNSPDIDECFQLRIIGEGFLKQMIRHIVSALWMVGSGKLSIEQFAQLLKGPKSDKQHWKVAPANGLFLYKINYPEEFA